MRSVVNFSLAVILAGLMPVGSGWAQDDLDLLLGGDPDEPVGIEAAEEAVAVETEAMEEALVEEFVEEVAEIAEEPEKSDNSSTSPATAEELLTRPFAEQLPAPNA